jgi:hypothetical protein
VNQQKGYRYCQDGKEKERENLFMAFQLKMRTGTGKTSKTYDRGRVLRKERMSEDSPRDAYHVSVTPHCGSSRSTTLAVR